MLTKVNTRTHFQRSRKMLKHWQTQVDWTFVLFVSFVVLHFLILAVQLWRNRIVLVFAVAPNTSRSTKRIGPSKSSVGQTGIPNRQKSSKGHPKNMSRRSFLRSWNRLVSKSVFIHLSHPLPHFCYFWGSNWQPFAWLLVSSKQNTWHLQPDSASTLF